MTGLFILAMDTASITPYILELGLDYVALAFAAIMLTCYKATADRFTKPSIRTYLHFSAV